MSQFPPPDGEVPQPPSFGQQAPQPPYGQPAQPPPYGQPPYGQPAPQAPYGQPAPPSGYGYAAYGQVPVASMPLGGVGYDPGSAAGAGEQPLASMPVVVAGVLGAFAGVLMCASTFMTWLTGEQLGYGTFAGNGWDDFDGTLSWGPLVAIFGVIIAVGLALAVVGAKKVAPAAFAASAFSLGLAMWQWMAVGNMGADIEGSVGLGLGVWVGSAVIGLCAAAAVLIAGRPSNS